MGDIAFPVFFAQRVERMPGADIRPSELSFQYIHVLRLFHDADINGNVVALTVNVMDEGGFIGRIQFAVGVEECMQVEHVGFELPDDIPGFPDKNACVP